MKYTTIVDGYQVTADTPQDMAALLIELRKQGAAAQPAQSTPPPVSKALNGVIPPQEIDQKTAETALKFLKTVRDAANGVRVDALMPVFGATVPKGIGSKSAAVNSLIEALGYPLQKVYSNPKTVNGRIWHAGRQIHAVIADLERRLA